MPMSAADSIPAKINVLTLAVADLTRAVTFYRDGLGLPTEGIVGEEFAGDAANAAGAVAMFTLENGLVLALYPELAKDADVPPPGAASGTFSIGLIVSSRDAVDAILERAAAAGGTLPAPPRERPWGIYSGYFADLDGHLWEIIWSPRRAAGEAT
jgi:uncharacterized protein